MIITKILKQESNEQLVLMCSNINDDVTDFDWFLMYSSKTQKFKAVVHGCSSK